MHSITIQVAGVQPPAPGKKRGKVIDTNNIAYQVGYPLLTSFQPGQTYAIQYKDDSFNGFAFKVVESAVPAAPGSATPLPSTTPAPIMGGGGGGGHPLNISGAGGAGVPHSGGPDPIAERIFVCGALNAVLGNPGVSPQTITTNQLVSLVNSYREVFARTFGGKAKAGDDMNDEIPF